MSTTDTSTEDTIDATPSVADVFDTPPTRRKRWRNRRNDNTAETEVGETDSDTLADDHSDLADINAEIGDTGDGTTDINAGGGDTDVSFEPLISDSITAPKAVNHVLHDSRQRQLLTRRNGTFRARIGVALRTVAASVRRNGPLTLAAVLSSAVALTLVGAALVTSYGVDNATVRWRGGVETIVFMDPDASQAAVDAVEASLIENTDVETVRVVSKDEAYTEFEQLFANTPDLVETVRPEALPVSLRITPVDGTSEDAVDAIGASVSELGGVWQVIYARDAVRSVLSVSSVIRLGLAVTAIVLGSVAALLSYAACRAAAFARRDELTIMRTVGAPRWLVRLPFICEGLFAGLGGAAIATTAVWLLGRALNTRVADGEALAILRNFSVSADQLWTTTAVIVTLGAAGGALGAAVAVGRYVRAGDGVPTSTIGRFFWRMKRTANL